MKLISTTEFVLNMYDKRDSSFRKVYEYAKFLKQPLKLEMFVPCYDNGEIIDIPTCINSRCFCGEEQAEDCKDWRKEYREAQNKVLFKGFEYESLNTVSDGQIEICFDTMQFMIHDNLGIGGGDIYGNDLEALSRCNLNLELTDNAIKTLNQ